MEQKHNLEFAEDKPAALPQGLNVLTILTFIGCGIGGLFTLFASSIYKFSLKMMDAAEKSGKELTTKEVQDIAKGRAAIELAQQNMIPLMITGIVGIALCLVGAIWMRKLKKDGYWLYVAGQILPLIISFVLLGSSQFTGVSSIIFAVGIPLLFVVLYTLQRKHLVK
jgi:hypothetical protein